MRDLIVNDIDVDDVPEERELYAARVMRRLLRRYSPLETIVIALQQQCRRCGLCCPPLKTTSCCAQVTSKATTLSFASDIVFARCKGLGSQQARPSCRCHCPAWRGRTPRSSGVARQKALQGLEGLGFAVANVEVSHAGPKCAQRTPPKPHPRNPYVYISHSYYCADLVLDVECAQHSSRVLPAGQSRQQAAPVQRQQRQEFRPQDDFSQQEFRPQDDFSSRSSVRRTASTVGSACMTCNKLDSAASCSSAACAAAQRSTGIFSA
ncbi:hypothetical protein DVH05_020080 [Phytophthora capsici]|nr:hypothetical protein DVH05_020080 [Phytophthora capsici]